MVSDEMQMSKTSIFWFHSSLSAMACLAVRSVMKSLIPDVLPGLLVVATYNVIAGASPKPCWGGLCSCGASRKCTFLVEVPKYPDVPSWHVISDPHQAIVLLIAIHRHEGQGSALLCTRWV